MTEADTEMVVNWRNSDAIRKNFIYRNEITPEEHLKRYHDKVLPGQIIQFVIIEKITKRPVGSVYLRDVDSIKKTAEYGIFIGEDSARGRGYGKEAAGRIVKFFFEDMDYDRLYLRVFAWNLPAIGSYKSAGFAVDEADCYKEIIEDKTEDIVVMSVLKQNYMKETATDE